MSKLIGFSEAFSAHEQKSAVTYINQKLFNFKFQASHKINHFSQAIANLFSELQYALLGKLSSTFVRPQILRHILDETRALLPPNFSIQHFAPNNFITYYQIISTRIINLDNNKKAIILDIPLLDQQNIYDLYLFSSIEMPFVRSINATMKINIENNKVFGINKVSNTTVSFSPDVLENFPFYFHQHVPVGSFSQTSHLIRGGDDPEASLSSFIPRSDLVLPSISFQCTSARTQDVVDS